MFGIRGFKISAFCAEYLVFPTIVNTNNNYFPLQHYLLVALSNAGTALPVKLELNFYT